MRWIFVGGCPRSGTTLAGQLIGEHSGCLTLPESQFKRTILDGGETVSPERLRGELAQSLPFRLWGLDDKVFDSVPDPCSPADLLNALAMAYARQQRDQPAWVVDHTPSNLRPAMAMTLAEIMPDAVFVHMVRDPRAVVSSIRHCDWGPAGIRDASEWWNAWVSTTSVAEELLGERCIRVYFEELVNKPEDVVGRIFSRMDRPAIPLAQLRRTLGMSELVRPPRASAWRSELPRFAQDEVLRHTKDLRHRLGIVDAAATQPTRMDSVRICLDELFAAYRVRVLQPRRYRARRKAAVTAIEAASKRE